MCTRRTHTHVNKMEAVWGEEGVVIFKKLCGRERFQMTTHVKGFLLGKVDGKRGKRRPPLGTGATEEKCGGPKI